MEIKDQEKRSVAEHNGGSKDDSDKKAHPWRRCFMGTHFVREHVIHISPNKENHRMMRLIFGILFLWIFILVKAEAVTADARKKYPYPLLTNDYSILNENDLGAYT